MTSLLFVHFVPEFATMFLDGKGWPQVRKADYLTAICEPLV
jgi:hypothetical protein